MKSLFKFEPKKELILVGISLLWMWFAYYASDHMFADSMLFTMVGSALLTMIGCSVVLPVWWIAVHNGEGLAGLNITLKRMLPTLLCMAGLSLWRFLEIRKFIGTPAFAGTILFNVLAIWEVLFIYGWMFTRFEKSFGKIPAIILTAIGTGIYHIGSLSASAIISLCLVIAVCAICYSFTENIFMLWPFYWTIGCSASTLQSGMVFQQEMIVASAIVLLIQIVVILILQLRHYRKEKLHIPDCN